MGIELGTGRKCFCTIVGAPTTELLVVTNVTYPKSMFKTNNTVGDHNNSKIYNRFYLKKKTYLMKLYINTTFT